LRNKFEIILKIFKMEIDKVIGLFVSIGIIIIISFVLFCCLGFNRFLKVYPEENKNTISV